MINIKRIFFFTAAVFLLLILSAYSYFFLTDSQSLRSVLESGEPFNPGQNRTLRLDAGWEAFDDSELSVKNDRQPDVFGAGSSYFRLKLDVPELKGRNAFMINPIYSAWKIWVNGKLIDQSGEPGADSERLAFIRSRVVPYTQDSSQLEIIIFVSNHSHVFGGNMVNWLSYGRFQDIDYREQQGKALDFIIIFALFSISLIHVFNFYYRKDSEKGGCFCLFTAVYAALALFTGRVTISYLVPVMNAGIIFRIESFLSLLYMPFLVRFISGIFPDETHLKPVRLFQVVLFALSISLLALPLSIGRVVFQYSGILIAAGQLYLLAAVIRAVKAGREGSAAVLIGFLVYFLCIINDTLYSLSIVRSVRLTFLGVFIFSLIQTWRLVSETITFNRLAEETRGRLDALLRQKESFFSRNSIELENPVKNIVELGESLLKGSIGSLNSEQIATSSLIVSNGIRLSNMISDILDFTSIRDNSVQLRQGPVDLLKVTRKVINSCEALVTISGVELVSELDRETPFIYADERRIEQVFYNVITNSLRHIQKGSVKVSVEGSENEVTIFISTRGSDLDEAGISRLFNAYNIGGKGDIDQEKIADLSLAIAGKLIELHGSSILVESSSEAIVYSFTMPRWSGDAELSEEEILEMDALINLQPVLDEIASDRDIEILVAGKDVEELQIFKSQLASMNYSVVPMLSGEELLSRVKENPPDLIISDVKLHDMSGYEVCSEIRNIFSKEELPVILVISREDVSDMMEGLTSGANDFLTRPYIQEEFLTRVNTHLQLSRISTVYSRFVPTEFLSSLGQHNITDVELGDQVQREMTILFVDIRAFTNLSENMTPEENFKFINSYLSRFSPMITNNGGFVDKFIGDAIMALFPDSPDNAIAAAKEMIDHVNVYNGHRANCGYKPINIGVGIHTGSMILGIIGDEKRMQGTVISDAVNLASRIQDVTKLYKANVVISQETFVKLENPMDYNFRFLGRVKVKGKDKAVALFEIFDSDIEEKRESKNRTKADFEEAIMKFSRREYKDAKNLLDRVIADDPDDMTAKIFIERIDQMLLAEKRNFLTSL